MPTGPPRVLIAGGGVAGLEAALALRALAGDRVAITLVAAQPRFVYRPLSVGVPFGGAATAGVDLLAIADDRRFDLLLDRVEAIDLDRSSLRTAAHGALPYDHAVLALGARPLSALPGALTFRGPQDVARFGELLGTLEHGDGGRIAFVARSATSWTLPLYELALMTARWATRRELDCQVLVVTPEQTPLEALGDEGSARMREALDRARVELYLGTVVDRVDDGVLWEPVEGAIPADLVVALPVLTGPRVAGLPRDPLGFVPVDGYGRVEAASTTYAVGDMTAHPVKQGGLAAQQADVAAACIAADVGAAAPPEPYEPVLRALVLTGGAPLFLRNPPADGPEWPAEDPAIPWWPPHKVMGAHLAPYLAAHHELLERR